MENKKRLFVTTAVAPFVLLAGVTVGDSIQTGADRRQACLRDLQSLCSGQPLQSLCGGVQSLRCAEVQSLRRSLQPLQSLCGGVQSLRGGQVQPLQSLRGLQPL